MANPPGSSSRKSVIGTGKEDEDDKPGGVAELHPVPPRIPAIMGEKGDGEEEGEKEGEEEPKLSPGVFPGAGRPLPEVVLQSLFAWLRSSDLSALCTSSTAAASPGERGGGQRGARPGCQLCSFS